MSMDKEEKKKILSDLGGIPEELYNELVHDFLAQAHEQIQVISEALQKNDFNAAAKVAHSLKGSSGNLRIHAVQNLAQYIELQAKENADRKVLEEHTRMLGSALEKFGQSFH